MTTAGNDANCRGTKNVFPIPVSQPERAAQTEFDIVLPAPRQASHLVAGSGSRY
jgi:hypothetical protein